MSEIERLMRGLYAAHRDFRLEWNRWLDSLPPKERERINALEPATVTLARQRMLASLDELYSKQIFPLEAELESDPPSAVEKIDEFLGIDIPAFRCGYAREFFLHKLKTLELTADQRQSLRRTALGVVEAQSFRREFRRWCRLSIRLADRDFVERLAALANGTNPFAARKARWMLGTILRHRKDLAGNPERES